MGDNMFFKVVCFNDNDVFEYRIEEDTMKYMNLLVNIFINILIVSGYYYHVT